MGPRTFAHLALLSWLALRAPPLFWFSGILYPGSTAGLPRPRLPTSYSAPGLLAVLPLLLRHTPAARPTLLSPTPSPTLCQFLRTHRLLLTPPYFAIAGAPVPVPAALPNPAGRPACVTTFGLSLPLWFSRLFPPAVVRVPFPTWPSHRPTFPRFGGSFSLFWATPIVPDHSRILRRSLPPLPSDT